MSVVSRLVQIATGSRAVSRTEGDHFAAILPRHSRHRSLLNQHVLAPVLKGEKQVSQAAADRHRCPQQPDQNPDKMSEDEWQTASHTDILRQPGLHGKLRRPLAAKIQVVNTTIRRPAMTRNRVIAPAPLLVPDEQFGVRAQTVAVRR